MLSIQCKHVIIIGLNCITWHLTRISFIAYIVKQVMQNDILKLKRVLIQVLFKKMLTIPEK